MFELKPGHLPHQFFTDFLLLSMPENAKVKKGQKVHFHQLYLRNAENRYCQVKVLLGRIHFTVFNSQTSVILLQIVMVRPGTHRLNIS